jgi:exodeoxyribonuclease V gamma subunit
MRYSQSSPSEVYLFPLVRETLTSDVYQDLFMGLALYRSNRLEHLAGQFCEQVSSDPLDPMQQELVVVQSIGMGRWLSLELSERLGIWANSSYLYPNALVDTVFRTAGVLPDPLTLLTKEVMTWALMKELPSVKNQDLFSPLSGYLNSGSDLKLFQLSGKIADMFDQYIAGRPEMTALWSAGHQRIKDDIDIPSEEIWQFELWRILTGNRKDMNHRAAVREKFFQVLSSSEEIRSLKRISVFGASTLPQFHLDILQRLSESIDITFYLLSATRHYPNDILSERQQIALMRKQKRIARESDHYDQGNALYASMGSLGKDFLTMLSFCYDFDRTEDEDFTSPGDDTLLHSIQRDILEFRDPGENDLPVMISPDDSSVMIHSCHSPMREVEVLKDYLLDLFDKNSDAGTHLYPRDILVMATDIDLYAPFIDAVFRSPDDGDEKSIPYSIADRDIRSRSVLIGSFISLFSIGEKRFASSVIMDLLRSAPLMRKWRFGDAELDTLRAWSEKSGIRWGADASDRKDAVGISYSENSFSDGITRLIAGYAMKENGELFSDLLPSDLAEGSSGELLGRYAELISILSAFSSFMKKKHTPSDWCEQMLSLLSSVFAGDGDDADDFSLIRESAIAMRASGERGGFEGTIDYRVVRDWMLSRLGDTDKVFGFLNGRITFCAMLPMRSIPFRVVCMIGMDDGKFPRISRPLSFDLMNTFKRPGDRSQRSDDRYLFLESIISARDTLYISYNGRSIRDNSVIPPSVLVNELIDYAARGYDTANGAGGDRRARMRDRLVTEQRLQPFSKEYFTGGSLFSYSQAMCRIAEECGQSAEQKMLFDAGLEGPIPDDLLSVDPDLFCSFFHNPSRFLLLNRLGIRLFKDQSADSDSEPLDLDYLYDVEIERAIVESVVKGGSGTDKRNLFLKDGMIPPGEYGKALYYEKEKSALSFAQIVAKYSDSVAVPVPVSFQYESDGIVLSVSGNLTGVTEKGILVYRGMLWKRDFADIWVRHLLLNAAAPSSSCESFLISRGEKFRFRAISKERALAYLKGIASLYVRGLRCPLQFFPKSSYAAFDEYNSIDKEEQVKRVKALKAANAKWAPSFFASGRRSDPERDDPYFAECFASVSASDDDDTDASAAAYPIDETFLDTALMFFDGMSSVREEL